MWHPPSVPIEEGNFNTNSEDERQLQLAIKKSLEPQKYSCQFCKVEVASKDDLQLHQLNCTVINRGATGSVKVQASECGDGEGEKSSSSRRKSHRKKKQTEKYAAYSQSLTENEGDSGDEEPGQDKGATKEVSGMMKRLSLDEIGHSDPVSAEEAPKPGKITDVVSAPCSSKNEDAVEAEPSVSTNEVAKEEVNTPVSDLQEPTVINVSTPLIKIDLVSPEVSCDRVNDSEEGSVPDNEDMNCTNIEDVVEAVEDVHHLLDDIDKLLKEHPNNINDVPMIKKTKCWNCQKESKEIEEHTIKIKQLEEELGKRKDQIKELECWKREDEEKLENIEELEKKTSTQQNYITVLEEQLKVKEEMSERITELEEKVMMYEDKVKSMEDQVSMKIEENLESKNLVDVDNAEEMEGKLEKKDEEIRQLTLSNVKKEETILSMEDDRTQLSIRIKQLLETSKIRSDEMRRISENQQVATEEVEKEKVLNNKMKETNEELRKEIMSKSLKIEQLVKDLNTYSGQNKMTEQLKIETTRKTKQIEELAKELKESNETSSNLKVKLHTSCENVNDLAEDIRLKKKELKEQEQQIILLVNQAEEHKGQMMQLTESIEQVRDENTRIKNQAKVERQEKNCNLSPGPEIAQLCQKFEDFKKDITNKLSFLTTKSDDSSPSQTKNKERRKKRKKKKKKPEEDSEDFSETGSETDKENDVAEPESEDPRVILRPGHLKYNEAVKNTQKGRKTLVLSTSITRDIKEQRFNECFSDGSAEFVRMRGWKVKAIKEDIRKNLQHGYFDSAVVHIGGNDLQDLYYPESFQKLAEEIIESGTICREKGAATVFIAGVTVRKWAYTWDRCRLLNGKLRALCRENNFIFIDNTNINYVDHLEDDVHLNDEGSKMLANNYLGCMYKAFASQR